jgi:uncharacterized MAPEG superfamily protein
MNELQWLAASCLLTAATWLLYVPNRMAVIGILRTLGNPSASDAPLAPWAQRAQAAHRNSVENLVVFSGLIVSVHILGLSDAATGWAAAVYFVSRVLYIAIYVAGLPVLRTLAFAAGWGCQILLGLRVLGAL